MANIAEFLQKILSARYGEEVRKSIHDAIKEIDNVADSARDSATNAASQAQEHARKAEESAEKAEEAATKAEDISAEITDVKQQVQIVTEKTQEAVDAAGTAITKAGEALLSAQTASEKVQDAGSAAMSASNSAQNASTSETNAKNSEENADYHSKTSKSYAIGGTGSREGEDTDNAKYYNQQASDNADRAEEAAERASAVADVGVATTEKAGIVKPDGETIRIDEDGTIHADAGTVDYLELENKPKINGTELSGDKSFEELGIASAEKLEETNVKVNTIIEKADLGIKETASGEEIHLTDSSNAKVREFALFGKAKQQTTSGKNILPYPYSNTTMTQSGVTWTDNGDGTIVANGKATSTSFFVLRSIGAEVADTVFKPNTRYILSIELKNAKNISVYANVNGGDIAKIANKADGYYEVEFTTPSSYSTTFTVALYRNADGNTEDNCIVKPMIRLATETDATYEPYTGGIPSPSPDYPQEIEVSGESYNLLENTATSQTINGVTFTVNEDGSVTANGTATANATVVFEIKKIFDEDVIVTGCPSGGSETTYYLAFKIDNTWGQRDYGNGYTVPKGKVINQIDIVVYFGYTVNNLTFYPMIRKASVKNDRYMPYGKGSVEVKSKNEDSTHSTTATIPTPNGLAGVPVDSGGNYTDQNGQQRICDEIVKYADGSGETIQRIGVIESYNSETITGAYISSTGDLSAGAKVLYQLAEPIRTPLTAEKLAEIEKLHTFKPVTNISNDSDCGMKVTYIADAKNYIDNRLAQIEQALVNNI